MCIYSEHILGVSLEGMESKSMNSKHLTLRERKELEKLLDYCMSFVQIADRFRVAHTTISREVLGRRTFPEDLLKELTVCSRSAFCTMKHPGCTNGCKKFMPALKCEKLNHAPFVCNACPDYLKCRLPKVVYRAEDADRNYRATLRESRTGMNLTTAEYRGICASLADGLFKQQSPYHIVHANPDDFPVSLSSVYRLNKQNKLAGISKSQFKRIPKLKPRKGEKPQLKVDRKCRHGRTLADYKLFCDATPDFPQTQMDSVVCSQSTRCFLVINIPRFKLQLMFIRQNNTSQSVIDCFNELERRIGLDNFRMLFPVILTDNGSEFSNPEALEASLQPGQKRTRIFYCDPHCSWQKAFVENTNCQMRDIFPKGEEIPDITQAQAELAASHLNSMRRKALNGSTPAAEFKKAYGKELMKLLGIVEIPGKEVELTPNLFKAD